MANFVVRILRMLRDGVDAEGRSARDERLSPLLTEVYVDIVPSDLDDVALHSYRGVGGKFSSRDVVFPTVPRTYDDLPLQFAFAERAAPM
jgi:hypothetical protein